MSEILAFTQELAARSKYKKLLYKSQDAENAKSLDTQLTHAFRIFEVSSVVCRFLSSSLLHAVLFMILRFNPASAFDFRNSKLSLKCLFYLLRYARFSLTAQYVKSLIKHHSLHHLYLRTDFSMCRKVCT